MILETDETPSEQDEHLDHSFVSQYLVSQEKPLKSIEQLDSRSKAQNYSAFTHMTSMVTTTNRGDFFNKSLTKGFNNTNRSYRPHTDLRNREMLVDDHEFLLDDYYQQVPISNENRMTSARHNMVVD